MDIDNSVRWDAPAHARWRGVSQPFAVGGWGEGAWDTRSPADIPAETSIYAITGLGTAFGDGKTNRPMTIESVPGSTVLIAEVAASGHHWMAPGDFDVQNISRQIGEQTSDSISGNFEGGFYVAFADAEVWFMSNSTPFESLSKFFTPADAAKFDREAILGQYRLD